MNIVYTLIVLVCMPGAWDYCSSGLERIQIDNIPTKDSCEQIIQDFKADQEYRIRHAICVPHYQDETIEG